MAKTATKTKSPARRAGRSALPPQVRRAHAEIERGVGGIDKAIQQIQRSLQQTERRIEADARARIRLLRKEAKTQVAKLRAQEKSVARTLKNLRGAAQGGWEDIKASADAMLAEATRTANGLVERFRSALKG